MAYVKHAAVKHAAIAAALMLAAGTGTAEAAKKCNIVGSFTDSLGSTGSFTSEKKGTVSNGLICAKTYALTVTKLTETIIDISGKVKGGSCGALTGSFTFQDGGCTSAAGSVTIQGFGTFDDTITRSGALRSPAADTSDLTNKLK
jgi:hypothetical protein